jgi:hypothetical protein
MSGSSSTEMMLCQGCNMRVLVQDMRSHKGQPICKACFILEKEEEARREKGKKSSLRLQGQEGKFAQVWLCADAELPLCGLCEDKSVFFAGKPAGEPAAAATALRNGDSPQHVLQGSPFVMPVSGVFSILAPGNQPQLDLSLGAPPALQQVTLKFAELRQRNQCFAELGKALGEDYTVQSKLSTDWQEVSRLPFIFLAVSLVVGGLMFWSGLGRGDGASPGALQDLLWKLGGEQLGLAGVLGVLILALAICGGWGAWAIKQAKGAPTEMRLVRRGQKSA